MKRLISLVILLLLVLLACWYFLVKDYNYLVRFETKHNQGAVYSTVKNWLLDKHPEIDSLVTVEKNFPNYLVQDLFVNDSIIQLTWKIEELNDSTSKVKLYTKDLQDSFKQNLSAIYSKNDFVKRTIDLAQNLNQGLIVHEEDYKITPQKEVIEFPETFCACVHAESSIFSKANSMMEHIGVVMGYINRHDLQLMGDPMLQVLEWNKDTEAISYDFCFPIEFNYQLPKSDKLTLKTVGPFKAIQTNFNGNYRISDRAWYTALKSAENKGIPVVELPVEIYRNDPHIGAGAKDWLAEVYMPVK